VSIAPQALERLAAWSDNYPYFVQLAGFQAFEFAQENQASIAQ